MNVTTASIKKITREIKETRSLARVSFISVNNFPLYQSW